MGWDQNQLIESISEKLEKITVILSKKRITKNFKVKSQMWESAYVLVHNICSHGFTVIAIFQDNFVRKWEYNSIMTFAL